MFKSQLAIATFALSMSAAVHAQNYTGPWFNAAESGWGLNIVHQGDLVFPTWFTYDADGKPLWLTVQGARRQADGSFTGDVFRTTGVPFDQITGPASRVFTKLGTAKLTFANNDSLSFSYTVNNIPMQTKNLTRLPIGAASPVCEATTASRANATNFSDIWWNPLESGWGINLFHQDNVIFATWFTYGATGRDNWFVVSRSERQADGSFTGAIQQITTGTPFNLINGAAAFPAGGAPNVGTMTFRFTNGERGSMTYTIGSVTQTKMFERQVFGSPAQICRNGVPAVSSAENCYAILQNGQSRKLRLTNPGAPTIETSERGMGTRTFEGQSALMWESLDAQGRLTSRQYARINGDSTFQNVGLETFDATSGTLTTRARYSDNRYPVNPAVGVSNTLTFTLTQDNIIPALPTSVINYTQTLVRAPNESVSVPAGTYAGACKINLTSNASTTQSGISINTRTVGPMWSNGTVGGIKVITESTVTAAGLNLGPPLNGTLDLLEFRPQ